MKIKRLLSWLAVFAMLVTLLPLGVMRAGAEGVDMSKLTTHGRTYVKNGSLYLFWVNSGVSFKINGTGVTADIRVSSVGEIYRGVLNVYVDGAFAPDATYIFTQENNTGFVLVKDLPAGEHTVELRKRNEGGYDGTAVIAIDALSVTGGDFLDPPAAPERVIEFVGDSITTGFANMDVSDNYSTSNSDGTVTYATLAAKELGAEARVLSRSGIHYCHSDPHRDNFYEHYADTATLPGKTSGEWSDATPWDFAAHPADVVVINLGTNDAGAGRTAEQYKSDCVDFLTLVREKNPNAVIVWTYGMMGSGIRSSLEGAVKQLADAGDDKVFYLPLANYVSSTEGVASGHPTVQTHINRSIVLADFIAEKTGWTVDATPMLAAQADWSEGRINAEDRSGYDDETVALIREAVDAGRALLAAGNGTDAQLREAADSIWKAQLGPAETRYTMKGVSGWNSWSADKGSIVLFNNSYAWMGIPGNNQGFSLNGYDGGISDGAKVTVEVIAATETVAGSNPAFSVFYGYNNGSKPAQDSKMFITDAANSGRWIPYTFQVDSWNNSQNYAGTPLTMFLHSQDKGSKLYVRSFRVFETDNPAHEVSIVFTEVPSPCDLIVTDVNFKLEDGTVTGSAAPGTKVWPVVTVECNSDVHVPAGAKYGAILKLGGADGQQLGWSDGYKSQLTAPELAKGETLDLVFNGGGANGDGSWTIPEGKFTLWAKVNDNPGDGIEEDDLSNNEFTKEFTGRSQRFLDNITTYGRTYVNNNILYLFWTNSGASFTINGTGATADIVVTNANANLAAYLNVYVDGAFDPTATLTFSKAMNNGTVLVEGLPAGTHTVELRKRNEAAYGGSSSIAIRSITVTDGEFLDPPAPPARTIEFIGDSITSGFGDLMTTTDYSSVSCDGTMTYAVLAAKELSANAQVLSRSGIHYCHTGKAVDNFYDHYTHIATLPGTIPWSNSAEWDFAAHPSDVVVINLGTNDVGAARTGAEYTSNAVDFLRLVREKNPDAVIIWTYGMMGSSIRSHLEAAVKTLNDEGDDKVFYLPLQNYVTATEGVSLGHPTVQTHINRSIVLANFIAEKTGWEVDPAPMLKAQLSWSTFRVPEDTLDDYVAATAKVYSEALAAGRALADDENAAPADILAAADAVWKAQIGLTEKGEISGEYITVEPYDTTRSVSYANGTGELDTEDYKEGAGCVSVSGSSGTICINKSGYNVAMPQDMDQWYLEFWMYVDHPENIPGGSCIEISKTVDSVEQQWGLDGLGLKAGWNKVQLKLNKNAAFDTLKNIRCFIVNLSAPITMKLDNLVLAHGRFAENTAEWETAIAEAEAALPDHYTAELANALDLARTAETQADVDAFTARLRAALDAIPDVLKGDADGDGKITSTDARLALQLSVDKIKETDVTDSSALDVDGDGKVTSTDARLILQYSVGKIKDWP